MVGRKGTRHGWEEALEGREGPVLTVAGGAGGQTREDPPENATAVRRNNHRKELPRPWSDPGHGYLGTP